MLKRFTVIVDARMHPTDYADLSRTAYEIVTIVPGTYRITAGSLKDLVELLVVLNYGDKANSLAAVKQIQLVEDDRKPLDRKEASYENQL